MRPTFVFFVLSFHITFLCHSQDGEGHLQAPADWRFEKLEFPLSFAPQLPLVGHEEVFFAPGWNEQESEEFWTYTFAWILTEPLALEKEKIQNYLKAYYDGLMKLVGEFDTVDTTISLQPTSTGYKGVIKTMDGFFTKEALTLNIMVEQQLSGNHWLFLLSPKDWEHPIWKTLGKVRLKQ